MTKLYNILNGIVPFSIGESPPDMSINDNVPYEIIRDSENFKHVQADNEMTEADLLKACGYKAGYVLFGIPLNGKIVYEVRRGIPRLD